MHPALSGSMTRSMTSPHPGLQPSLVARLLASVEGQRRRIRAHPLLNPTALVERSREWLGGHPADPEHEPHLVAAIAWLVRAHDATPDGGISRAYSLAWHPYFQRGGWLPSYPETTGYIIPTLYAAARRLGRAELAARAEAAARWEIEFQLPTGAVLGGVIGAPQSPAVFNTGQVLLGWLAAFEETGQGIFADAARRAACYLVATLDADGHWRRGNSRFARADATLYNTRTAWALAEAGVRLEHDAFTAAAARSLRAAAERAAHALGATVRTGGWMPGRYRSGWSGAVRWSCLTGQAQMANNWIRLAEIMGDAQWLEPVPAVLRFLKRTQNRRASALGLRGGIKGAWPVGGEYGAYEVLSWATKFFADALMRHEAIEANGLGAPSPVSVLA